MASMKSGHHGQAIGRQTNALANVIDVSDVMDVM